ncbi:MAG: hypothetical protein ACTTJZ_06930 [Sphaerochaetaceae bacterium]
MSSFQDLRIVDNFYQTSLFFPMPTILVGTLAEDGSTTFGPYSLCQPFYVAGKDYYAMMLICRNSSNTCQNLLRNGKCSLNFLPDKRKYFKEMVRLGWPGDKPQEKMKEFLFTPEDGLMAGSDPVNKARFPKVIAEAFQVMECTWMRELDGADKDKPSSEDKYPGPFHDFNGITTPYGAHFVLRVDKILMKEKQYNAIINGVKSSSFPHAPVDYGYRDSKNFWYVKHSRALPELLPEREASMESVRYAAKRADDKVKFSDDALIPLLKVPRIFLPTVLRACVAWAKENNCTLITAKEMQIINDKRSKEKKR